MNKHFAFLFDLDGVVIDTESQYGIFWKTIGEKYHLEIEHFEQNVKGTTVPDIIASYFYYLPNKQQEEIKREAQNFDTCLEATPIEGVLDFLNEVNNYNLPMGLVTSSSNEKLKHIFQKLPIKQFFRAIMSADCVSLGKPHPMGYLKASQALQIPPQHCFVFEDSYNGIKAGKDAGMSVIGLSTSFPADSIRRDCIKIIPNFLNFHLSDMEFFFREKK